MRVDLDADGTFRVVIGNKNGGTHGACLLRGNVDRGNRFVETYGYGPDGEWSRVIFDDRPMIEGDDA